MREEYALVIAPLQRGADSLGALAVLPRAPHMAQLFRRQSNGGGLGLSSQPRGLAEPAVLRQTAAVG